MRAASLLLIAALAVATGSACSSGSKRAAGTTSQAHQRAPTPRRPRARPSADLVERTLPSLPQPLQDGAGAESGSGALVAGGLNSADASVGDIQLVRPTGSTRRGSLPSARHDAAAATVGVTTYVFGGGDAVHQIDEIVALLRGHASVVGHLPQPASDVAAATIGGTAYVIGGYTGTAWLNTILAWQPGHAARVAARLPEALRYSAVTAVDGKLVIAGGSLQNGSASQAIFVFDPGSGHVRVIGHLPVPTTHAAAATLGHTAFVVGGRGASVGTPTARIVAVDPAAGTVRPAGELRVPRSDLAAIGLGKRILLVGGRTASGTTGRVADLVSERAPAAAAKAGTVPRSLDRKNIYASDAPSDLSPVARRAKPLVYVPNSDSNTVDEINPATYKIVRSFPVGRLPQHVTPAYDLKTLYVLNDEGNSLTPIDPQTGAPGRPIPVDDPYNMYFTPDGRYAIVVAERLGRLDFRFPHSFRLHHALRVPCRGVDHMDFSADGRYLIATCEFSGQLIKVDVQREKVVGLVTLPGGGIPQDVKLSPDGKVFYVADMSRGGIWEVTGSPFRSRGFIATGAGTHGLYVSRDATRLYITNRGEGSVSVLDLRTRRLVAKWHIPGGGSPDMGNVSANGRVLWLSGRWNADVYAIDTRDGKLLAKIPVGSSPHGLCVWPQPGRYSLGHTGILR